MDHLGGPRRLPQRIIFMGTPEFARPSLLALIEAGVPPVLVVTQPDRPAGRGHVLKASPVKEVALEAGIEVLQPATLKDPSVQDRLRSASPDMIAVAAFGQILPKAVLAIPPLGCVNVHASLLPRHRGASPIARAIWEGDSETGICIMKMEEGLDTGPVFLAKALPIAQDATAGSLEPTLAQLGARLLVHLLPEIAAGTLTAVPQDESRATLAPRIKREQAHMDFGHAAAALERQVRAFQPWPVCFIRIAGEEIRVLRAAVGGATPDGAPAGSVLPGPGLAVACGDGRVLHLLNVQRPGKKPMSASELMRGFPIPQETDLSIRSEP
jgi:methionyl-tRNA formyltransferase